MTNVTIHAGDELFSDTYKMKLIGDVVYEVEGKVIFYRVHMSSCRYIDQLFVCFSIVDVHY